ncbi:MAG: DUF2975 domain-containing protein [Sphingomonadales bacterium]|nr:DUF2975 domain-containing protein [Sphingomonadales bacterium]
MTTFRADPLLGFARGLLAFVKGALIVAMGGVVIAMPAVMLMKDRILAGIAREQPALANIEFIWALCGLLASVLVLLAAMWFFTHKLKQIVDTVATGDPFIPENAERLKVMAWTSIALQVIAAPMLIFGAMIAHRSGHPAHVDVSVNGLALALVLFILARVFRTGAAMREELEGTV